MPKMSKSGNFRSRKKMIEALKDKAEEKKTNKLKNSPLKKSPEKLLGKRENCK